MKKTYFFGTGRRKSAIARVRLTTGSGAFLLNDKESVMVAEIKEPLVLAGQWGKLDLSVKVCGGGKTSQISAIRHGLSHALVKMDEGIRSTIRKAGLLTRDPREKERKKYGLKKARRAPQWSKR